MGNTGEKLNTRIKRLRAEAGLSQVALANLVPCSVQTIKDIEGGRKGAGLKVVKGISNALGISVEELTGRGEPEVKKIITHKMKDYTRRVESIPDYIYDLALELGPDHKAWPTVRDMFKAYVNEMKEEAKKGRA